jgi:glycosyltransferase involved in cell wall biosynthesis
MRILMLTDFYAPIIGGMEIHVRNLGAELAARGHDVAVVTLWHEGLKEFEQDHQVRVYRIRGTVQRMASLFSDPGRRFAPPLPDPEASWALRHIVARERPEIVHAHSWLVYSFIPLKCWSGAKLVFTLHDCSLVCVKKSFMYQGAPCSGPAPGKCLRCSINHFGLTRGIPTVLGKWMMSISDRTAVDMFLPVSRSVAVGSGLVGSQLSFQVIPNFVRDDVCVTRGDWRSYLAQLPDQGYLLFVGALKPDKGIDVLLRAYTGLTDAPPLVFIGAKWPDSPTEFPPNTVMFENWPHDAVMQAWSRSLVGLVPSVLPESCPTVAMEAMASSRPVIGSRIGGLPDLVVDGDTGLLVAPGDPVALRQAIQRLLDDPDLRERMGQAGQRKVAEFQASTVVPLIEQVYQKLARGVASTADVRD